MRWVMVLVLCLGFHLGYAQNSDEWLRQKKTQLRYLVEQVSALNAYGAYLEKGYVIVRSGLTAISDLKQGEFSLHKDYFSGLLDVKPEIQKNWKVVAILLSTHRLLALYGKGVASLNKLKGFNPQYHKGVRGAWTGVLAAVGNNLSELKLCTASKELSLSDAARVRWIDKLYQQMQSHEAFAVQLSATVLAELETLRLESANANTIRLMYGN